jgi:monoamine oxidase
MTNTTAIVIGGGFAGVTAARELSPHYDQVILLEGNDRLGGRAYSTTFEAAGKVVELGGAWVSTRFNRHVTHEIERYRLALAESHAQDTLFRWGTGNDGYTDGFPVKGDDVYELERVAWEIGRDARRIDQSVPRDHQDLSDLDISISDYLTRLRAPESVRRFFYGWAAVGSGALPEEWSALTALSWIATMDNQLYGWFAAVSEKVDAGSGALLSAILDDSKADVRLASPVKSVDQTGERVVVTIRDSDTVEADAVVVATAYNAWGTIEFTPALNAAKQRAQASPHPGRMFKFFAVVDRAPEGLYAIGYDQDLVCVGYEGAVEAGHLLVCFSDTPTTIEADRLEDVQKALEPIIPGVQVLATLGHVWEDDPWARGTWMNSIPGVLSTDHSALQALEGRVAFASADIANGWPGWIDGALETAKSAVEQLVRSGREGLQ